jgi:DNA-directed RNA polymerase specialized sigma24 family protein
MGRRTNGHGTRLASNEQSQLERKETSGRNRSESRTARLEEMRAVAFRQSRHAGYSVADAEDHAADIVFRGLQYKDESIDLRRVDEVKDVVRWTHRVTSRYLIDVKRERDRKKFREVSLDDDKLKEEFEQLSVFDEALAKVLDEQDNAVIAQIINTLAKRRPDSVKVMYYHKVEKLKFDEIARRLGKKPGTCRVLCHQGLRLLKQLLTEADFFK